MDDANAEVTKVVDQIMAREKEVKEYIGAAEKREQGNQYALNADQVKWIRQTFGETYKKSGSHVKTQFDEFVSESWLPDMLSKYEESEIKNADDGTRAKVRMVAKLHFLEKVWFPAKDYANLVPMKDVVSYWRAKLYKEPSPPGIEEFNDQVKEVAERLL